jgi:hypothetical protein
MIRDINPAGNCRVFLLQAEEIRGQCPVARFSPENARLLPKTARI